MSEEKGKFDVVICSILRQADYKPGDWLVSDRHSSAWLCIKNPDLLVNLIEKYPILAKRPYLVFVRDPRDAEHPATFARPMTSGTFAFGGNWLWSDDPEFPADHPIPIHDAPVSQGAEETTLRD